MQPVSLPQGGRDVVSFYQYFSMDKPFLSILKYGIFAKMRSPDESIPTLKQLIEYANTTQRELSKRTGIAEVTINSWVAKKKIPRLDNALALCRELGVSLKTLSQSLGLDTTGIPDDSPN
jgi:DNA-binding XRE family transcriptional regulator